MPEGCTLPQAGAQLLFDGCFSHNELRMVQCSINLSELRKTLFYGEANPGTLCKSYRLRLEDATLGAQDWSTLFIPYTFQ
jgi:hypothetical protein